jgi:hypothetical protein
MDAGRTLEQAIAIQRGWDTRKRLGILEPKDHLDD